MKIKIAAALAFTGAALLAGCATMSKDQCLAGAWGEQGYKDGAAGLLASRLAAHAEACTKHGVVPDESAYLSAREDGLRTYCTRESGFRAGREGESYGGVCSAAEEEAFLPAYQDGRLIHTAEEALSSARSSLNSAINRISDREESARGDRTGAPQRPMGRRRGPSRRDGGSRRAPCAGGPLSPLVNAKTPAFRGRRALEVLWSSDRGQAALAAPLPKLGLSSPAA